MASQPFAERSRSVLPIPDQLNDGLITFSAKDPDTAFPPIEPLRPPEGAPNVLLVLLDDVGFGASSAFGGPCQTPTAERLARDGLKYNRFHTTAICSPTRAALLSGRNHHAVGMGGITEMATSAPGYSSVRTNAAAPLAETLRLNGYSTAQFGKCHEVPQWETGPHGPFDRWPSPGNGFEYFYGFVGGETNQYYPALFENTIPVEPDRTPEEGYHLMEDLTDRAIQWIKSQKAMMGSKPFFCYFAPGATHAPHHVPKEWADKYAGQFDQGWDRLREETLARQKELGVVPADADLTARPAEYPAWDDTDEAFRPVLSRQMEVYAGFLEYADHHVGRLIDSLDDDGLLDDTVVIYIIGDNGASAEGTIDGTVNEYITLNHAQDLITPTYLADHVDDLGTPQSYNHYAVGWAHAMCTPFQWTKQMASHWGGTRNGTIVHWPSKIQARGEIRSQFCHVVDVAPTILELAGLPHPTFVHGVQQIPIHGTSFAYTFDDADAAERHTTQYFEILGNRGIYHQGWSAIIKHKTPWLVDQGDLWNDPWELYDGASDFSQAHNIAADNPDQTARLRTLFMLEAAKYNVYPLDDRSVERSNADIAGRPQLIRGTKQTFFPGMRRLTEGTVISMKNRSHSVTAEITVPDGDPITGVIIAQGGAFGGWSVYLIDGRLSYCYNQLGINRYVTTADQPVPAGTHQVRVEFAYDGGGIGKGGDITLYIDGVAAGSGRVDGTQPFLFSMDETVDIGSDTGTPVSDEYGADDSTWPKTAKIGWVQLDLGDDSHDHLLDAEHLVQIALTRQ